MLSGLGRFEEIFPDGSEHIQNHGILECDDAMRYIQPGIKAVSGGNDSFIRSHDDLKAAPTI
jgi:hypothetical protein